MKPLYLFANWKMYLDHAESLALATEYAQKIPALNLAATFAVFPSDLSLVAVQEILAKTPVTVGPQNVFWLDKGGYTGEISASMFKSLGCNYALVGHSERRHLCHETNRETRQKLEAVLAADMTPVLCVGETLEQRKKGEAEVTIEAQIRSAFTDLVWPAGRELIVAYEPVWAVSTGESCDPTEANRVAELITQYVEGLIGLKPVVLYGGSVRPDNVRGYVDQEFLQGVLVGGAATKIQTWMDIITTI